MGYLIQSFSNFLHCQSLEQLLLSLEIGLQRGQQQAFPEASGAAEEIISSGCY